MLKHQCKLPPLSRCVFSRFYLLCWFLICFLSGRSLFAGCVDSIRYKVQMVQCKGLRNGSIRVDTVFGGVRPFYYSLDGLSFSTRPYFESLWAGEYTVYVRDAMGCIFTTIVQVGEPPLLEVKLTASDDSVASGMRVMLHAVVLPEQADLLYVSWRPPNLFNDTHGLDQEVQVLESTTFAVEISDKRQCIARDQVTVEVIKTNVFIPNVISTESNADAYFTVFAGEGVAKVLSLRVYNRSGSLVFERENFPPNDPLKGWNGRWKGKVVQSGVYPYLALVEFLDGSQKTFQGALTVLN